MTSPPLTSPAPYQEQLLRLSELLGALSYLRTLCDAPEASAWRSQMAAILDGESGDEARKILLTGAFNRGYHAFQQTYHVCNASASATVRAYLDESSRIARDVASRYAG